MIFTEGGSHRIGQSIELLIRNWYPVLDFPRFSLTVGNTVYLSGFDTLAQLFSRVEHLRLPTAQPHPHQESLPARVVAQHLLLLNRWQLHLWRKAGLVDVSMDGKGCLGTKMNQDAPRTEIASL